MCPVQVQSTEYKQGACKSLCEGVSPRKSVDGNQCDIAIAQIVILIETTRVCFTMILMFGVLAVGPG
jgi:hypothetical protein